jgi:predicted membrane channel-forming protein YqfA (hemolysin III family)
MAASGTWGNQNNRAKKLMKRHGKPQKEWRHKMKKLITACLIVVALIAFTTQPTMAEPITLTVLAITGLTVVASLATADTAYHAVKDSHNQDGSAAVQKNDGRAQAQNDSHATKANQERIN